MQLLRRVPFAIAVTILLAACGLGGTPQSPAPTPEDEFDPLGAWQLVVGTADGAAIPIVEGHPITANIQGSEISGSAACNHYGGRVNLTGGRLTIAELGMTAMACVDAGVMESEAAYTAALSRVEAIGGDDDQLVLSGSGVELRFDRLSPPPTADLVDAVWVLETLFVGDIASSPLGERATLELRSDGTFSGSTGCRSFSGEWLEQGAQIIAPIFGMEQTECPAEQSAERPGQPRRERHRRWVRAKHRG
jgi:heat shock protein HslJ